MTKPRMFPTDQDVNKGIYCPDIDKQRKTKPEDSELLFECPKHGEYQGCSIRFGKTYRVLAECPTCVSERKDEVHKMQVAEEKERHRQRRIKKLWKAGVSQRNMGKSFDDFDAATDKQKHTADVCRSFADRVIEGEGQFNLILTGSVGTGKTHLACSIIQHCLDNGKNVRLAKLIEIIRALKGTWSKDSEDCEQAMLDRICGLDLLIIDEVGVQFGSDTEKMFVFDIIDGRYENCLPTMLISNKDLDGIRDLIGDRCIDRLKEDGGKVMGMDWESYRGKNNGR